MAGKVSEGKSSLRRDSVLGNGKRARMVMVTRSSQGELMATVCSK